MATEAIVPSGTLRVPLLDLLRAMVQETDQQAVLASAARVVATLVGARQVTIAIKDDRATRLGAVWVDPAGGLAHIPLDAWLARSSALTEDPERCLLLSREELVASRRWAAYVAGPGEPLPTSAWLSVPIPTSAGTLGTIAASDPVAGTFRTADLDLSLTVAAACGEALERSAMEERLAGALAQRQALFGVLSHELRTPITTIYGGSRVLRQSGSRLSHEAREQLLVDIADEAERLFRLVEDLLVLSRAEGGVLTVESEPVHLGRLIARVIASEQARWPRSQVITSVEPGLPPVEGDETLIEQVLRNLVSNAAKYAGTAGPVMVTATVREPWVEVGVTDQGPGLTDEEIAHVFELFYRAPSAATKAPGAGIGLYACHELAMVMGGELLAGRAASGGGEFTFRLRPIDVEIG